MSYSLLVFVGVILFLILIFGVVISSFFLSEEEKPKQIGRTQREHHTKTLKEAIERSAVQEKLNRKVSTSEDIFISTEQIEKQVETNKPVATNPQDYKEGEPIHILEKETDKVELKRKIPTSQQPPSQQTPLHSPKSSQLVMKKITQSSEKEGSSPHRTGKEKVNSRGVLPKQLIAGHKKEQKYKEQQEKRMVMKQDLQDRSSIYKDPTEGICVHTRADCPDYTSDCFLGAGHLDLKECVEKAERIQENINKHNERFGSADTRRKSGVKYISWAPGGIYPDIQNPQCMILSESANVMNDQKGWKTYVKNPTSFTMTQNPSVYLVEGKCPTIKNE